MDPAVSKNLLLLVLVVVQVDVAARGADSWMGVDGTQAHLP